MLNPEQQKAVDTHEGRILCLASPGSGKTRVIVERVIELLKCGVDPRDILSLTFTREAANEMRRRVGRTLLGLSSTAHVSQTRLDAVSRQFRLSESFGHHVFATFHSFALRFVKSERQHIPNLRDAPLATSLDINRALKYAIDCGGLAVTRKELPSYISKMKRLEITPEKALDVPSGRFAEAYARAYAAYDKYMHENGCLDFDSLMLWTARLLRNKSDVRNRWQIKYFQVDEAQDTDECQLSIASLLTEKYQNFFAVGDTNQALYGWRGSIADLEKVFCARWPDIQLLVLPENYRSSQEIVAFCKSIAPIKNITVEQFRTNNEQGTPPVYWQFSDDESEAKGIVTALENPATTAILTRTNAQLMWFEDICQERGIKYQLLGKSGFWRRYEIENAIAYVRAMVTQQENAVAKVIRAPYPWTRVKREDKDEAIAFIKGSPRPLGCLADYHGAGSNVLSHLPERFLAARRQAATSTGDAVRRLLTAAGIFEYYQRDDEEERDPDNNPEANLEKLIRVADKMNSLSDFLHFTEKIKRAPRASKEALTLSTIHKAKGLQWPTVVVAGVTKDVLPHKLGDPDEEARIYYVAASRAEKKLIISCYGTPSEYFTPGPEGPEIAEPPKSLFSVMEEL